MYIRTQHFSIHHNRMSFLIQLLILSILPCLSTSERVYGIMGNASIKTRVPVNHNSSVQNCTDCLCYAFDNLAEVDLFTCTKNVSNFICQFYHPMPARDEIESPINGTDIYVMKNETFKDNCCNTEFIVQKINRASPGRNFINRTLRSVIEGDDNTIVAVASNHSVIKFNKTTLEFINETIFPNITIKSIGYCDNKYYLGTNKTIEIYNKTLDEFIYRIAIGTDVTTIRFLNGTYMLVGASSSGVRIYEKDANGTFRNRIPDLPIVSREQVHAIGIVNESAFYVGWDAENQNLSLYTRDQNNLWKQSTNYTIAYNKHTSDIVVDDNCKRIWVTQAYTNLIFIYEQDKNNWYNITVSDVIFNFLILENSTYTLVTSHESSNGLYRIQPDLNCRTPP